MMTTSNLGSLLKSAVPVGISGRIVWLQRGLMTSQCCSRKKLS